MNEIEDKIKLTAPSKTFLLGEYAVLTHGQALLIATSPYFVLAQNQGIAYKDLAAQSPAAKFYQANKKDWPTLYFQDPHRGQGGFGASGAQFVLLARYLGMTDPWQIWQRYQQIIKMDGVTASGVDILAHCSKDLVFIDINQKKLINIDWPFKQWNLIFMRTGHKLATHEHLATLTNASINFSPLATLTTRAYQALIERCADLFLATIKNYAKVLLDLNLVAPTTQNLLVQLKNCPEVLAAKGCGAMGADVVLAMVANNKLATFLAKFSDRDLILFPEKTYV